MDGLRIGSSSIGLCRNEGVGRAAAEKLTAFGVECEGQRTIAVGQVLRHVGVICAEFRTALLDFALQLIANGFINDGAEVEVGGQETGVERHEKFRLVCEKVWLVSFVS